MKRTFEIASVIFSTLNFQELSDLAKSEKVSKIYQDNTEEAVAKNVFGAPTYIYNNELVLGTR